MCCDNAYKLDMNFITLNSYICVEINDHAMILIIETLKELGLSKLFLPWLFSSQSCESFFRSARSFTSTESTRLNFSLKEFLDRCRKVDANIPLMAEGIRNGILYPRYKEPFENPDE